MSSTKCTRSGYRRSFGVVGRGWALDNVFVERLWRSVKYLKEYPSWESLPEGLTSYFTFYCHERPHQALGNKTPAEVYHGG
jgi:putative transposase